jgi:hypothetical protein
MPCDNSTDKDKTAAYFSHQVAALVQALFFKFFCNERNHKPLITQQQLKPEKKCPQI